MSERDQAGRIPVHPYSAKWYGAHWVLVALAELGYPTGDLSLVRPAAVVIAEGFRVEAIMVQRSLRRPAPWQTSSRITGRVQPHARTAAAVMVR